MNISLVYHPTYRLTLTKELIESFMLMSSTHYDNKCADASRPPGENQGFITGWRNCITYFADDNGEYAVECNEDTVQTLMKICENSSILETKHRSMVHQFCEYFRQARRLAVTSTAPPVLVPFKCPVCRSTGFQFSTTGHGCTFCDGTEGGCGPGSPQYEQELGRTKRDQEEDEQFHPNDGD